MSRRTTEIKRTIEDYTTRKVPVSLEPPMQLPTITVALKRWSDLVALDEASPSTIDGFPKKTPGARPPEATGVRFDREGAVIEASDDDIGTDWIVEQAAIALVQHGDPSDAVHRARLDADHHAGVIAEALPKFLAALDRADNVRSLVPVDAQYCWVAKVLHRLPFDEVWKVHTRTTFKGQLKPAWPEERPVCRWVYDFVRDHKRLPTVDEMRQRLEREVVKVHQTA